MCAYVFLFQPAKMTSISHLITCIHTQHMHHSHALLCNGLHQLFRTICSSYRGLVTVQLCKGMDCQTHIQLLLCIQLLLMCLLIFALCMQGSAENQLYTEQTPWHIAIYVQLYNCNQLLDPIMAHGIDHLATLCQYSQFNENPTCSSCPADAWQLYSYTVNDSASMHYGRYARLPQKGHPYIWSSLQLHCSTKVCNQHIQLT